jgi:hypothetical protein
MVDLFDGLEEYQESPLPEFNRKEAFIAIAFAIIAADGHIAGDEQQELALSMVRMTLFRDMTPEQFEDALYKIYDTLNENGVDILINAAKTALTPELRETAFFFAVDLSLSDRVLEESEKNMLGQMQQILEINPDTARKIIEVAMIKNRS